MHPLVIGDLLDFEFLRIVVAIGQRLEDFGGIPIIIVAIINPWLRVTDGCRRRRWMSNSIRRRAF
jgi:hypothetical protein